MQLTFEGSDYLKKYGKLRLIEMVGLLHLQMYRYVII